MLLQFLLIFIPFLFDVYYNLQLERPRFPTRKTEVSSKLIWSSYTQFKSLWRELNAYSNMWCLFQPRDMQSLNKQRISFCILMLFDKQSSAVYYKEMKSSNLEQIKIIFNPICIRQLCPWEQSWNEWTSQANVLVKCVWLTGLSHSSIVNLLHLITLLWYPGCDPLGSVFRWSRGPRTAWSWAIWTLWQSTRWLFLPSIAAPQVKPWEEVLLHVSLYVYTVKQMEAGSKHGSKPHAASVGL